MNLKMQEQIRLALGADDRCVLWRNSSGAYDSAAMGARQQHQLLNALENGNVNGAIDILRRSIAYGARWVHYGVGKGGSDLLGLNRNGRFLALEVKDGTDRLRPDQKLFLELVTKLGGYAAEVRSPEQALAALEGSLR